MGSYDTESVC